MAIDFTAGGRGRNNPLINALSSLVQHLPNHTGTPTPAATPAPAATTPAPPASTLPNATQNALSGPQAQAFQAFYNTPVYQFPLQEGLDAVNANYAGRGALQSGAALKAVEQYGAASAAGGLRDWMNYLGNQQSLGATAASGQTGLSANYANTMSNANTNTANALSGLQSGFANNASNLTGNYANNISNGYQNLGNAISQGAINQGNINSNAAIAHANNSNSLISGIGNALGSFGGYMSYGG